jgi:transcriptional regulator GlxA family with amidase domain
MSFRIAILVYDDFDLIDAGGPYEVFLTASRLQSRGGREPSFVVELVSPGGDDVTAFGGMTLTGLGVAENVVAADVVLVPGTIDVASGLASEAVTRAVRSLTGAGTVVTSVCTGAFLLARDGLLAGISATTHWEDIEELGARFEVGKAVSGRRWVDEGTVVTSGGLTSGMHMALHLVERFAGADLAIATARQLDIDFDPAGARNL